MPRKLPRMQTPIQKAKEQEKKMTFSERYEEDLKRQLFEESENNTEEEVNNILDSSTTIHKPHPNQEWDVPITEKIEYFDPELSYELTGYRPITMDKGLDFKPSLFTVAADTYTKTGHYTQFPYGSKKYRDFWMEEFDRCINGYTVGKYHITGDNYFYLNYYRMDIIVEGNEGGEGRAESFPKFLSKQYEWFHYVEMASKLHLDACALKARGVGWSEMTASMSVCPYTVRRKYKVLLTCIDDAKLTPLKNKCWFNLDWLNTHTDRGMRHVRLAVNNVDTKRATKKSADGTEYGWGSEIDSIIANTSDKIRGDRRDRLVYEEAGSNNILTESWIKGKALVELGGQHFGLRVALGCVCAGTKVWTKSGKQVNIEDLKKEDGILGFHEGKFLQEDIESFQEPKEKECVRIITDKGILECSADHPIFTRIRHSSRIEKGTNKRARWFNYEWVRADEVNMKAKYNVIGICNEIDIWGDKKLFDPYLVGLLIGDGTYGHDKTPRISNCDPEVLNYVESNYETSLDRPSRLTVDGKLYKELRIKKLCPKLKEIGIYGQVKTNKRLPTYYNELTKEDTVQMLAGLFDTDGTVPKTKVNNYRISITQSSKEILGQIDFLLKKLGIYGKIYKIEPRIAPNRKDKNPCYKLEISDAVSIVKFAEQIPIRIKYKQEVLQQAKEYSMKSDSYKHYYTYIGIREAHVIDVEHIGNRPVYNLTAAGAHTYLANNFITHNTGGDDMALGGLRTMFLNPKAYDILPYKNYDSDDGRPEITAFFLPAHKFALTSEYLDSRGVTNWPKLKEHFEAQRAKLLDKDYLTECAEHCFTPREALSKHGDNVFDAAAIAERMVQIKVQGQGEKPRKMALLWDPSYGDGHERVIAKDSPSSHLLVVETPQLDETGKVVKNLYVAGIDAIDMGRKDSATDSDVSDFCVVIKKRVYGMQDSKYVAMYKYRPNDIREAYDLTMKLLTWYNCKAMLEYTKISIQTYFKEKGKSNLFMTRPAIALSGGMKKSRGAKQLIGLPATEAVIRHGLELIANFIADYWHTIDFEDMLDQMLNYTYENKRKFDIIAAMGQCEIGDEDMAGVAPKTNTTKNQWKDFGWYVDERGYRRFGTIPTKSWKAT